MIRVLEIFWFEIEINYSISKLLFHSWLLTLQTQIAFSMVNETPIPTVDDMKGKKDETDKCVWYCEIFYI